MKALISKILSFIGLGISILFSLVFAFIELRTLFAGDWSLFNSPVLGFFTYFCRSVFFLGVLAVSVCLIMYIVLKEERERYLFTLIVSGGLFIASFMSLLFYVWFIGLLIVFISLIPLVISLLRFLKKKETE